MAVTPHGREGNRHPLNVVAWNAHGLLLQACTAVSDEAKVECLWSRRSHKLGKQLSPR